MVSEWRGLRRLVAQGQQDAHGAARGVPRPQARVRAVRVHGHEDERNGESAGDITTHVRGDRVTYPHSPS